MKLSSKPLIIVFLSLVGLLTAGAQVQSYVLNINDFSELKLVNGVNVEYTSSTDTVGKAYFTCSKDVSSRLIFVKDGKSLKIEVDMLDTVVADLPTLYLYSTALHKVENTSDSTLTIHNIGECEHFKAKVVGNGRIVVNNLYSPKVDLTINTGKGNIVVNSGEATNVTYKNVGTGLIDGKQLNAKTVKAILLGTGNVECSVEQQISVYGSGSGKVKYLGNPEKIINRSIGVKSEKML